MPWNLRKSGRYLAILPPKRKTARTKLASVAPCQISLGAGACLCYPRPREPPCDPYHFTFGLVVTASVRPHFRGARLLIPDNKDPAPLSGGHAPPGAGNEL